MQKNLLQNFIQNLSKNKIKIPALIYKNQLLLQNPNL